MALLVLEYLNGAVAISKNIDNEDIIIGTGFLFGKQDQNSGSYDLYLVTNRHVIEKNKGSLDLYIKKVDSNFSKRGIKTHTIDNNGNEISLFHFHSNPKVDIAITHLSQPEQIINTENLAFFYESDKHIYTQEEMIEVGISEGDGVFVIGFPSSITGKSTTPVVRRGIISRIQDYYEYKEQKFLIDAFVFPGNSGGPVFIKPEIHSVGTTKVNDRSRLIGIVSGYLPYEEKLISTQTGKLCQKIEHNSGLTIIEPINSLLELISEYEHNSSIS